MSKATNDDQTLRPTDNNHRKENSTSIPNSNKQVTYESQILVSSGSHRGGFVTDSSPPTYYNYSSYSSSGSCPASIMPSAWGLDELIAAPGELCRSGAKSNLYRGAQDIGYDYSQDVAACENAISGLQAQIDTINSRLEELYSLLNTFSPADISARQDINQEIAQLQNARFNKMVKMQALEESMRRNFGVH